MSVFRPWSAAMDDALYGERGFYRAAGAPGRHFRTAAHASPLWPEAIAQLCHRVDDVLGSPPDFTVVDVGAGGGELLNGLASLAPDRWSLVGIDVADQPPGLAGHVDWQAAVPEGVTGVVLAVELLDVVPVDVVTRTEAGLLLVEVDDRGRERVGPPPPPTDVEWLDAWWPLRETGERAETGWRRDETWSAISATVQRGIALAVDYPAVPSRDVAGTLTGFRAGRQVMPVPDSSCDITAHVCFESLLAPGDALVSQRDALRMLAIHDDRPRYDGDSAAYLAALSRTSEAAELTRPDGMGGFNWLLRPVGCPSPLAAPGCST